MFLKSQGLVKFTGTKMETLQIKFPQQLIKAHYFLMYLLSNILTLYMEVKTYIYLYKPHMNCINRK